MSKFPLYIALCAVLIFYALAAVENPSLEILGEGTYSIYSRQDVSSPLVTRCVSSGIGFIYYAHSKDASALRALFDHIDGESIEIPGISARQVFKKLGAKEVSSGYGYSPKWRDFIKVGGQRINLQVVERGETTVVGWPVILGSY